MSEKSTTGIKLDEKTKERLKALGEIRDRSPHYLMREAISEFLDREEAVEEEQRIVQERWARYELTGIAVEHDEVVEWIDRRRQGNLQAWPKREG